MRYPRNSRELIDKQIFSANYVETKLLQIIRVAPLPLTAWLNQSFGGADFSLPTHAHIPHPCALRAQDGSPSKHALVTLGRNDTASGLLGNLEFVSRVFGRA